MTQVAQRSPTEAHDRAQPLLNKWGPYRLTRDAITTELGWRYCEVAEDSNPVYWDEEFAAGTRFGGIVFPPQGIFAFTFAPFWSPGYVTEKVEGDAKRMSEGAEPAAEGGANRIVTELGYTTATMVGSEFEYIAPIKPGDGRIKTRGMTTDVSIEKQTRPGKGVFITSVSEYRTEFGDKLVARSTMTLLMYDSSAPRAEQ